MEVVSYNNYAGFVKRLIAFIIDSIIIRVGIRLLFIRYIFTDTWSDFDTFEVSNLFHWHSLVAELVIMFYFILCESSAWQGTLGKRLMAMKVVDMQYRQISPQSAVIRYLSKYLSSAVLGLGFVWIIFSDKKQGWHDMIANTLVIES